MCIRDSGDPGQQFFSDGLSESLIDALSRIKGLRVIGRTSSFQFRNSKDDARSIGKKLGVIYPVSYTHLDVYKRQAMDFTAESATASAKLVASRRNTN